MNRAEYTGEQYLDWRAVADMFRCGRSKAMLIIHAVGPVYVGHRVYVRASDLNSKIAEDGEIKVRW